MAMVRTAREPVIDDDALFEEADKFEKEGDWTEERHEILEKLSMGEIIAEILQGQAEHPERYLTPEEFRAKIRSMEEEEAADEAMRRAELVGA